jgi:osmotically inducible protein OsmC
MITKKGSARWNGGFKDGRGRVSTESGVLNDVRYGARNRFEGEPGSNPEELIGAAHAACFSMALSLGLERGGLKADEIATTATVSLEQQDGGFAITKVHLDVTAKVPGTDEAAFLEVANGAKQNCPVSKLLNADITMDAKLA